MDTTTITNDTMTLSIDGMSCGHCVKAVTKALSAVPGVRVKSVAVGTAQIEAKDGSVDGSVASLALAALEAAGYPARATTIAAPASGDDTGKSGGGCCGG